MARRRELGSIANGLVGSFNSRNNDVEGYWGIGKLYKSVAGASEKVVSLELVDLSTAPSTTEFYSMLNFYHEKLIAHLGSRHIPIDWVKSAVITASFEVEFQPKYHFWRSALGRPCLVCCDITDDKGRHHRALAYNNCRPHDPTLETRSARASNF